MSGRGRGLARLRRDASASESSDGNASESDSGATPLRRRLGRGSTTETDTGAETGATTPDGSEDGDSSPRTPLRGGPKKRFSFGRRRRGSRGSSGDDSSSAAGGPRRRFARGRRARRGRDVPGRPDSGESSEEDEAGSSDEGRGRRRSPAARGRRHVGEASGEFWLNIDDADVGTGGPVPAGERAQFVDVDFADGTSAGPPPIDADGDGKVDANEAPVSVSAANRVVYLQSWSTGRFKRITARPADHVDDLLTADEEPSADAAAGGATDEELLHDTMLKVSRAMGSLLLLAQGLLAGVAVLHIYVVTSPASRTEFLRDYVRMANEVRRMFYVFCTVSFVAACDKFWQLRARPDDAAMASQWETLSPFHQVETLATIFLYLLALVLSLFGAPADAEIDHFGNEDPEWYQGALADDETADLIENWHVLAWLRLFCCIGAWLLVCKDLHRELQAVEQGELQRQALRDELAAAHERAARLTGQRMDRLTNHELQELVQLQKAALEEGERQLELRTRRTQAADAHREFAAQRSARRSASAGASPGRSPGRS